MIVSKEYNDELLVCIKNINTGLYNLMKDFKVQFTNISFIIPLNEEFINKYNLNKDFVFIATLNDWNDVDISIYYKGGKLEPVCFYIRPDDWVEPHLLDVFQECIKQDTHTPNIKKLETFSITRSRKQKLNCINNGNKIRK